MRSRTWSPAHQRRRGWRTLLSGSSARDAVVLARFLDESRVAFGTRVTIAERDENGRVVGARDAHVWHCSLSLASGRSRSRPTSGGPRSARKFIEQMRFAGENAPAQCRWVAVRHGRSAGGSDHAHLVVTLVAEDGSKASKSTMIAHEHQNAAARSSSGLVCGAWRQSAPEGRAAAA